MKLFSARLACLLTALVLAASPGHARTLFEQTPDGLRSFSPSAFQSAPLRSSALIESDTITPVYPLDRLLKDQYTGILAINYKSVAHSHRWSWGQGTLPTNALLEFSWPNDGFTSPRAWTYMGFGNYLDNSNVQLPIQPSPLSSITQLLQVGNYTWTGNGNFNVTYDAFHFKDKSGTTAQEASELQIYYHAAPTTFSGFLDNRGATDYLGTYTSPPLPARPATATQPAAPAMPSIVWKASRDKFSSLQAYVQFYPTDGRGNTLDLIGASQVDVNGMLKWLTVPNPTTGVTYFSPDWLFTGGGMGVEPLNGAGTLLYKAHTVYYDKTTPIYPTTLPTQTNYYTGTSFADTTYWNPESSTPSATGFTEVAGSSNVTHNVVSLPLTVRPSTTYKIQYDTDTALNRPWSFLQVFDGSYSGGRNAQAYYDTANQNVSGIVSAVFTNVSADSRLLSNGKTRNYLTLTTDSATTQLRFILRAAIDVYKFEYPGEAGKGLNISNFYVYDPSGTAPPAAPTGNTNVDPAVPTQTNLVGSQNLGANPPWDREGGTTWNDTTKVLTEVANNSGHGVIQSTVTAATGKQTFQFDIDRTAVSNPNTWVGIQLYNSNFSAGAQAWFDLVNKTVGANLANGSWSGVTADISTLTNGKLRVRITVTTGTDGVKTQIRLATGNQTTSYQGDASRGLGISNIYLYAP